MSLMYERGMGQRAEEQESADFGILDRIEKSASDDPELEEALESLEKTIVNYNNILASREKKTKGEERLSSEETEESDLLRKTVHDALIDRLNYLSRLEVARKKEPHWRTSWGPLDSLAERQNLTRWAQKVGPFLEQQQEEKRRKELEKIERLRKAG